MLFCVVALFFFKQKTAYDMRISDWSSDVCSSDLVDEHDRAALSGQELERAPEDHRQDGIELQDRVHRLPGLQQERELAQAVGQRRGQHPLVREETGRASCRERVCQYV